jgi:hypothetical protein
MALWIGGGRHQMMDISQPLLSCFHIFMHIPARNQGKISAMAHCRKSLKNFPFAFRMLVDSCGGLKRLAANLTAEDAAFRR